MEVPIVDIVQSRETVAKVSGKHYLSRLDVEDFFDEQYQRRWNDHPKYGRRLHLTGSVRGRRVLMILSLLDAATGTWELRTAFYE